MYRPGEIPAATVSGPVWVKKWGRYEVEVDGMTSTCTGMIVVQERFSREVEWYSRGPVLPTVLWDTPLWLNSKSLLEQIERFAQDVITPLELRERNHAGAVESVVSAVARLKRWNRDQPGHVSPVGRLRVRWSDPRVLVIEVWDARRSWLRSASLADPGPGYRYFTLERVRVR